MPHWLDSADTRPRPRPDLRADVKAWRPGATGLLSATEIRTEPGPAEITTLKRERPWITAFVVNSLATREASSLR